MNLAPTAENGYGVAHLEGSPTPVSCKTSIDKVVIKNSDDVQFGPRFVASTINYVDKTRNIPLKYWAVLLGVVTLMSALVLSLALSSRGEPEPRPRPVTEPATEPFTDPYTAPYTDGTTSTEPPVTLPSMWFVPFGSWSLRPAPKCLPLLCALSLQVGAPPDCASVEALRRLDRLTYNFYLTPEGLVYEGHGWGCAPNYTDRYSRTAIKVAVCGNFTRLHGAALHRLLEDGSHRGLDDRYNLLPECCAGEGPVSAALGDFLFDDFGGRQFRNPECLHTPACGPHPPPA